MRSGVSSLVSPWSSTSTSRVRGPQRTRRTRPASCSSWRQSSKRSGADRWVAISTTRLRNTSCSTPPTGSVSYSEETATTSGMADTARRNTARLSPILDPRPRKALISSGSPSLLPDISRTSNGPTAVDANTSRVDVGGHRRTQFLNPHRCRIDQRILQGQVSDAGGQALQQLETFTG